MSNNLTKQEKRQRGSRKQIDFRKWLSWKRSTASRLTESQEMSPLADSKPLTSFLSLRQLKYSGFIQCACHCDYSVLVASGEPTADELESAWLTLLSEYHKITGSVEVGHMSEKLSEIEGYRAKIVAVSLLVHSLRMTGEEVFASELRETWGYNYKFTADSLENDLERVEAKLKNDKNKLAIAVKQYEAESFDRAIPTEEDFYALLIAMGDYKHMVFDADVISTYDFAIRYKEYKKYCEVMKSKQQ